MVSQKRRKQGKTDYRARLKMLKSGKLRLVVRLSSKNILLQVVQYEATGDKVLVAAHTNELKKLGWSYNKSNLASGYLVGLLAGVKSKKKGINEVLFDCGLRKVVGGGILFAVLKGVVDSGLNVPHSEESFPDENRIKGKHVVDYYKSLDDEKKKKLFSGYIKQNLNVEDMEKTFDQVKVNYCI